MDPLTTVADYIDAMGVISKTDSHEVITECLEYYGLAATRELTVEQAAEYWQHIDGDRKLTNVRAWQRHIESRFLTVR